MNIKKIKQYIRNHKWETVGISAFCILLIVIGMAYAGIPPFSVNEENGGEVIIPTTTVTPTIPPTPTPTAYHPPIPTRTYTLPTVTPTAPPTPLWTCCPPAIITPTPTPYHPSNYSTEQYVPYKDEGYVTDAHGNYIILYNKAYTHNPTYTELREFLEGDITCQYYFEDGTYKGSDRAEVLHNEAETHGINAGFVWVDRVVVNPKIVCANAFQTTDRGLVFVDCYNGLPELPIMCPESETPYSFVFQPLPIFTCAQYSLFLAVDGLVSDGYIQW